MRFYMTNFHCQNISTPSRPVPIPIYYMAIYRIWYIDIMSIARLPLYQPIINIYIGEDIFPRARRRQLNHRDREETAADKKSRYHIARS